jgi:hypothetical protein
MCKNANQNLKETKFKFIIILVVLFLCFSRFDYKLIFTPYRGLNVRLHFNY